MAGAHTLELNDKNFEAEVLKSDQPVLVDFWAEWCGPCRKLAPVIDEIAKDVDGQAKVGKVNVDESPALAAQYNVRAIPTLVVFKDGQAVAQEVGVADKQTLLDKLLHG